MEKAIQIFNSSIDHVENGTIYVSDDALRYFNSIKPVLDNIANDLIELDTGNEPLTPESYQLTMMIFNNIENFEKTLIAANKTTAETANRIINSRDILIKFSHIKRLLLSQNLKFRKDGIEIMVRTGNLYPVQEVQEFISMLNKYELQHIMQIVEQEKTLIEKTITNSSMHILAFQKLNQINAERIIRNNNDEER